MVTGAQIRSFRKDTLGESQAAFAARFGVHQSTVQRWEEKGPPPRGPGRVAIERLLESGKGEAC
jgi:DNA-binding transcriptional regulator YiaG